MRRVLVIVFALTAASALLLGGCKKESGSDSSALLALLAGGTGGTYGGTSPVGDFIEVTIDRINKTVTHVNYTTGGGVDGPFPYTAVSVANAYGFSIINRAEIGGGDYVLFSEFPGAAVVYQMFDDTDAPMGWPVYVVKKSNTTASSYYGKAYNWMMFFIDGDSTDSDMECGFAAFDISSEGGLLYGAGYSNRREAEDDPLEPAIQDINEGDAVSIDAFTWDDTMRAFVNYESGHDGDMDYAMTLTGTPSGSAVLDFGPELGGGGALAIPQADSKAFSSSYAGTYFAVLYEYNKGTATRTVDPIKVVISDFPGVSVFNYADHTDTDMPIFMATLQALEDFTGGPTPPGDPVVEQFHAISLNDAAISTVVREAHLCHGSFIAANSDVILVITFDPSGRFCSYTMFDNNGTDTDDGDDVIRFGFAIKDANYTDSF